MFFILSKVLNLFLNPLIWLTVLLLLSLLIKKSKVKKISRYLFIVLFFFITNPFIATSAMRYYEISPISLNTQETFDIGVILTGVVRVNQNFYDRTFFSKGADRVTQALELYKNGKVKTLVVSGGDGDLYNDLKPESLQIKEFLITAGVNPSHIIIDTSSRNTHENAKNTRKLLDSLNLDKKEILLITSAFHMKRASLCFNKQGIKHKKYSCDLYTENLSWNPGSWLYPSSYAIHLWQVMLKEWVGLIAYKLKSYI